MTPADIRMVAQLPLPSGLHELLRALADVVEAATRISDPKQWIQNEWTERIGAELRIPLARVEALK